MPVGTFRNAAYGIALPLLGMKGRCRAAAGGDKQINIAAARVLCKRHIIGACIQQFRQGRLTECLSAGCARLEPEARKAVPDTLFRTASIAKMVTALLVFRLQTMGRLSVGEDVSALIGYRVRNPRYPSAPVSLGALLSHTSGILDSPAYLQALAEPCDLRTLLQDDGAWLDRMPGAGFRYSNLAAGLIGSALESRFGESLEVLAQRELFLPLGVEASFDVTTLNIGRVADSYRVLPPGRAFDAHARMKFSRPLSQPNPERHYTLASGNLYITAPALSRLALLAWNGGDGFIDREALRCMKTPVAEWPGGGERMRHGMGLLCVSDPALCSRPLWGHQGLAYGAVNGVFFDAEGNGFASLNSGASEQRMGHLALINRDLITLLLQG